MFRGVGWFDCFRFYVLLYLRGSWMLYVIMFVKMCLFVLVILLLVLVVCFGKDELKFVDVLVMFVVIGIVVVLVVLVVLVKV